MECVSSLLHAEAETGGMSFYVLVSCRRGGRAELPNMVKDALDYSKEARVLPVVNDGMGWPRLQGKDLLVPCRKRPCKGIVKVWCKTGFPLYPFLTDVGVVKGSNNYAVFPFSAVSVKEGGGTLLLQRPGSFEALDLRRLNVYMKMMALDAHPVLAPPNSFAVLTHEKVLFFNQGKGEVVADVKERKVTDVAPFFFGYAVAILTKEKVEVYRKVGEKWELVEEMPSYGSKEIEWCSLEGEPAITMYGKDKVIIRSLRGDMAVINVKGSVTTKVSVDSQYALVAYEDEVKVINFYTGDEEASLKVKGVKRIAWALYSDFAALCSDQFCWIYSNLSKKIVIVRKISGVTGCWWGSSTYNLFLARGNKLGVIFFNPHAVRNWRLVIRHPISPRI